MKKNLIAAVIVMVWVIVALLLLAVLRRTDWIPKEKLAGFCALVTAIPAALAEWYFIDIWCGIGLLLAQVVFSALGFWDKKPSQ